MTRTWTFPASSGQERVWLAQQLDPGSPVFTVPAAVRLRAASGADVVAALRAVVARHESLRTALELRDGELVQVVHAEVPVAPPVLDGPEPEGAMIDTVIDTASAPLWRARVVRLGPDEWLLDAVVHHAVFDAASLTVLAGELAELCAAHREGREPRLPELAVQYPDYAAWERRGAAGPVAQAQLAHWRERLAGLPAVHGVPTDRPRAAELGYAGAEVRFAFPPGLPAAVDALAARLSATPFAVLLAAWAALLGRSSGSDDVVIGTTTWGRDRPELGALIGMFVNPVVLRIDLGGEPTGAELVGRVRRTVLDATEHAAVPFQAVVGVVRTRRDPGVQPLYQLGVNLLPGSGLEPSVATTAQDDLGLDLAPTEGRLRYRTALFDAATAGAVVARYLALLDALVAGPDRPVADLPLADDAERVRVAAWGTGPPPAPAPDAVLHELVAARAAVEPNALAVEGEGASWTRAGLAARAAGVAHHLRGLGVGPGSVVAVCGAPSPPVVAALLGVLSAGAAYLPLDPATPPERLALLVADAGARVLLAVAEGPAPDGVPDGVTVLRLDADPWWEGHPAESPAGGAGPGDPAYVIHTSGSTGRPKGVVVEHRAVVAYLRWACGAYPGLAGRAHLHSSIAFDLSVTALFGPLLAGGSVRTGPLTGAGPAPTFLKATPSHLDLLAALPAAASPTVDLVLGGEALTAAALAPWRARHPGVAVTNEYGPTEAAVGCVAARIAPGEPLPPGPVPIGRPVAGMRALVLDPRGAPVPAGVVGELLVAGPQLARGYLGRPGPTAERFVLRDGERCYRTGDLVRWRADGALEYRGRADDQVSLHGYRIEPGEVVTALRACDGVRDAAVVLREDVPGVPRLVGYLAGTADPAAVVARLRAALPAHLVPSALVPVDALPLTPNGKLDRARLPPPPVPGTADDRAPATAAEELVAEIVADLLGLDRVGADADLFALGGDSLVAIRAATRIREAVDVDVPVRAVFAHPTVAGLAAEVERLLAEELDQLDDTEVDALLARGGDRA